MGFCLLQKTWVKIEARNIAKNFFIVKKKSKKDKIETTSKRKIQKTAEATGDSICN